jgi:hypothetical protein
MPSLDEATRRQAQQAAVAHAVEAVAASLRAPNWPTRTCTLPAGGLPAQPQNGPPSRTGQRHAGVFFSPACRGICPRGALASKRGDLQPVLGCAVGVGGSCVEAARYMPAGEIARGQAIN